MYGPYMISGQRAAPTPNGIPPPLPLQNSGFSQMLSSIAAGCADEGTCAINSVKLLLPCMQLKPDKESMRDYISNAL